MFYSSVEDVEKKAVFIPLISDVEIGTFFTVFQTCRLIESPAELKGGGNRRKGIHICMCVYIYGKYIFI